MKKIVFTIALLAILSAISYASTSAGGPNYKQQFGKSAKTHKKTHHTHIVMPCDHYSI